MAVPKKKTSARRRDMRRSHDGLLSPTIASCPQCSEPVRPHTVCRKCGSYRGVERIQVKD